MSDYKAYFNGHDLSALFVISPPERNLVTWEPTMVEAVIGAVPTGTKAQPMEITLRLTTFAETLEQRLADLRTLSGWMSVDEPKRLYLSDEMIGSDCLYREAMPKDTPKVTHAFNAATAEVKFICPDPRALLGTYPPPQNDTVVIETCPFDNDAAYQGTLVGTAPTDTIIRIDNPLPDDNGAFQLSIVCYADDARSRVLSGYGGTLNLPIPTNATRIIVRSESRRYSVYFGNAVIQQPAPLNVDWIRVYCGHPVKVEVTKGTCDEGSHLSYNPRWW